MFIRSQNGITIIDMSKYLRLYAEPSKRAGISDTVEENLPHRIYADSGDRVEPFLGEYENKGRAICVLNEVCEMIQRVQPNYVYFMPAV